MGTLSNSKTIPDLLCVGYEFAFVSDAKIATLGLVPEAQKDQLKIAFVVDTSEQAKRDDCGFQITAAQPDRAFLISLIPRSWRLSLR